jgi:hypothetical protein
MWQEILGGVMGAAFNFTTSEILDKKAAEKNGQSLVETAEYDHGHAGYTGTFAEAFGVQFLDEEFETWEAAEEFLETTCIKWDAMLIVTVNGDSPGLAYGAWCSS